MSHSLSTRPKKSTEDAAAPKNPNSRDRQREATRKAILASALEVFAECGFEGATTRAISARAGVNHAMIQYYFENKDLLWRAAVDFLFERFNRELHLSFKDIEEKYSGNTRDWISSWLRRYVHYCARYPEHARLMMQASMRGGEQLDWLVEAHLVRNRRNTERLLNRLVADHVIPDGNVWAWTYVVVGAAQVIYALGDEVKASWGVNVKKPENIEAHAQMLINLLLRDPG